MSNEKQSITVVLPVCLVEWIDGQADERMTTRTQIIKDILLEVKRKAISKAKKVS